MTRLDGGFDRALAALDLRTVTRSPVLDYLQRLLDEYREVDEGEVATYIPELGRADPEWFGICVVTADGHVYEVGDTALDFTIQSISKPFVFGMALEDQGRDVVLERVGVEPSGNPFNAIVVDDRNRPFNPMVNAGAIATTSLVPGADLKAKWRFIHEGLSRFAGRKERNHNGEDIPSGHGKQRRIDSSLVETEPAFAWPPIGGRRIDDQKTAPRALKIHDSGDDCRHYGERHHQGLKRNRSDATELELPQHHDRKVRDVSRRDDQGRPMANAATRDLLRKPHQQHRAGRQ